MVTLKNNFKAIKQIFKKENKLTKYTNTASSYFSCRQLDAGMLGKIPILKQLRALEQKAGKDVTLKVCSAESVKTKHVHKPELKSSLDPKHDLRHDPKIPRQDRKLPLIGSGEDTAVKHECPQAPVSTLYLGGLPAGLRVSELKGYLRELDAVPVWLTWQGAKRRAFLEYGDEQASDQALDALQGLCVNGHMLHVERARSQKTFQRPVPTKDVARTNQKEQLRPQHPLQPPSEVFQGRGRGKKPEKNNTNTSVCT